MEGDVPIRVMNGLITGSKQSLGDKRRTRGKPGGMSRCITGPIQPGLGRDAQLDYMRLCLYVSACVFTYFFGFLNPCCSSCISSLVGLGNVSP